MKRSLATLAVSLAVVSPIYAQTQSPVGTQAGISTATKQFVETATISDMFEIQSSKLVEDKSNSQSIKQFARKMVEDHTKTSNELKSIGQKLVLQLPSELDPQHRQKLDQLRSAVGEQFDRQYRLQQIEAHQSAVSLFEDYSKNGDNGELKSWAQTTLPHLQQHLRDAQRLPQHEQAVTQAIPNQSGQGITGVVAGQSHARAIPSPSPTQVMASDLRGTSVYGSNNENIGDINDIVLDRSGRIAAVVVGVGGFLGIGEKDVAIPYEAIEIRERGQGTTASGGHAGADKKGTINPERIVLRGMTKQDLQGAPKFRARGEQEGGR